jgi:hypothetical protein
MGAEAGTAGAKAKLPRPDRHVLCLVRYASLSADFPLLANRLTRPGSEHALAQWREDYFVCNANGSRWMPVWKPSRRVKVGFEHL